MSDAPLDQAGAVWFGNIVLAVHDLDSSSARLREVGFDVVDGGTHPQFGTANRIIPLGRSYLELLAPVDRRVAASTPFGQSLLRSLAQGERLTRWSLRVPDLDQVAPVLGVTPEARSRRTPSGRTLRWRAAALDQALVCPHLPFFVEWQDDDFPGAVIADRAAPVEGVAWLAVSVEDVPELWRWALRPDLPLRVSSGPPALYECAIGIGGRDVVIAPATGPRREFRLEVR